MATTIWEFFGYRAGDKSERARTAAQTHQCPFLRETCEKRLSDGVVSGVCALKPVTTSPVICCPIRLYANDYAILRDVARLAFDGEPDLAAGSKAINKVREVDKPIVAVFGKRWGRELRLPQKEGRGGYFVDWVLALLDERGELQEFVAVEVQTIDTTGNYRNGRNALLRYREIEQTSAGLNWENVNKRILPQLIYKGQVLQREEMCKKGLFFVCPNQVYAKAMSRLGGADNLVRYALQPASITFLTYEYDEDGVRAPGDILPLKALPRHSTTVYRVQEAFNNVTLPQENVYRDAILSALRKSEQN